ncbi:hypothetical protein NM208_g10810 [Fusarium decemcellulare]|uniref:Uncharacterized protein n=1 Tax=Fusarium decemcellulare TaxID=57161 RepID=A0ACC1RWM1_9HYPO|nr:hypothetical protein NM208_g10810 [Fusarium decemcellulare]
MGKAAPARILTPGAVRRRAILGKRASVSLLRVHWKVEDQDHVLRPTSLDDISAFDFPPDVLQDSFLETYNEYCFAWCPVIEPADLDSTSPLLKNALALAASQIKPNAIHRASPEEYYNKAKKYFYEGQEANPITAIKAILLFYWWSPISPLICSQDSIWWWTGMAIRMAQEIGLHREPDASIPPHERGLRRRIWWTLFARERLTALSQGRPCLINLADCDVKEPVLEDFPDPQDVRAETFIQWVRLCRIIGAMSEHVTRPNAAMPFPSYLFDQLGDWIAELPGHLMLKIATSRTIQFNREVSLLFLPYLTAVTLLQFTRTGETATPKAGTTAMLAATCVARTFQDLLLRGGIRYLPAISGWYITVALLALLSARRVENLASMANEHIQILQIALNELSTVYAGTDIAVSVFERLIGASSVPAEMDDLDGPSSDSACLRLFPFVTPQTNDLVSALLDSSQAQISQQLLSGPDFMLQFDELLDMVQNIPPLPEQIPTTSSADRALPDCTA